MVNLVRQFHRFQKNSLRLVEVLQHNQRAGLVEKREQDISGGSDFPIDLNRLVQVGDRFLRPIEIHGCRGEI